MLLLLRPLVPLCAGIAVVIVIDFWLHDLLAMARNNDNNNSRRGNGSAQTIEVLFCGTLVTFQ